MKVLHITSIAPMTPESGIPSVLIGLTNSQNKIDGFDVRALSLVDDVNQIDSPYFDYIGSRTFSQYLDYFTPDLAIIHSFFHVEYVAVARELKQRHIPFAIEPHGAFGKAAMHKGYLKKIIANITVFKSQIKDAAAYVYLNQAECDDSFYTTGIKSVIVPNGVNRQVVDNAKKIEHYDDRNPKFIYLSRFDVNHKGMDYLFDALDILDTRKTHVTVSFYGRGNDQEVEYVNIRIANYRHIDVKNCGPVYGLQKKEALEQHEIMLLTSRYEGFPMTILDAMSYGLPCVVTPGTNMAEEIQANGLGWVSQLDAEAIADTMLKAVADYKLNALDYIRRTQSYVLSNYTWDTIGQISLERYNDIIGTNKEQSVGIYIATHKDYVEPIGCRIPIEVGAANRDNHFQNVRDNMGDNISYKNSSYCELTAWYWIWKNSKADIVGLEHYRRRFDIKEDTIEPILKNYDFIVPTSYRYPHSLEENYRQNHIGADWDTMLSVLREREPDRFDQYQEVFQGNQIVPFNMFITNRKNCQRYFEWLFPILEAIECRGNHREVTDYNQRYIGFLAERLFTAYLSVNDCKVKNTKIIRLHEDSLGQKLKHKLVLMRNTACFWLWSRTN